MRSLFILVILSLASCTDRVPAADISKDTVVPGDTIAKREQIKVDLPHQERAHPDARKFLKAEWLYSTADEHAPFGSDDAADAYAAFVVWRKTNPDISPTIFVRELFEKWQFPTFDLNATDYTSLKTYIEGNKSGWRYLFGTDAAIIATAFGQLYMEGRVEKDLRQMAITAIKRESTHEIIQSWEEKRPERQQKLAELLQIMEDVKVKGEKSMAFRSRMTDP
jgi:uncharacterized protein YfeS